MEIDKIKDQIKNLTPKEKLNLLKFLIKKEKNKKDKKQIIFLIEKIKNEKKLLDEEIGNLERQTRREEKSEPLENLVQETIQENPQLIEQKTQKNNINPASLYGLDNIQKNIQYLSPEERKKSEYKSQPDFNLTRSTHELNLDESKRLEKEKKKYETGLT